MAMDAVVGRSNVVGAGDGLGPSPTHVARLAAEAVADCVHCGFCLPACPTYRLWQRESDSPRGRIQLVDAERRGRVAVDATFVARLDACLGCLACVTACPSGVRYDHIIDYARAELAPIGRRGPSRRWTEAIAFAIFPHRRRLRWAAVGLVAYQRSHVDRALRRLGVWARLPVPVRAAESLAPRLNLREMFGPLPSSVARPPVRGRVLLLQGCVQSVLFRRVNAATVRVLNEEGWEVVMPPSQGCCGALSLHEGRRDEALAYAKAMMASTPEDLDAIIVNSAGCGSAMKQYGELFSGSDDASAFAAKVRDVTEWLDAHDSRAPRRPVAARIAYHDACHLSHAQGVRSQPRQLLHDVPSLEVIELVGRDQCCGSAGLYNIFQPDTAQALGREKAADVWAADVDAVVTGNPGCALQLQRHLREGPRGSPPAVLHTIEVLDASIRGVALDIRPEDRSRRRAARRLDP